VDVDRIQREFVKAQNSFQYLELHPTIEGKVFAKTALQTPAQLYVLTIRFPEHYPSEMPRVYVDAPPINYSPHMYREGNICYLHPSMWNPGFHDLSFVIARAAKWLNKYEVWKRTTRWPGAEIRH
jgi:ubiquitin-protein ligase